jgi:beta-glucosidase
MPPLPARMRDVAFLSSLVTSSFVVSACSEAPNGVVDDNSGTSGSSSSGTSGSSSSQGGTGTGATGGGGTSANGGSGTGAKGGTGTGGSGGTGTGGSSTGGTGMSANGGTGMTSGATGGSSGDGGMGAVGAAPPMDDASCLDFPAQNERAKYVQENHPDETKRLSNMSTADKLTIMSGPSSCPNFACFDALGLSNQNIPDFRMRDGPRGIRGNAAQNESTPTTAFAVAEARAASFDTALEYRVGQAMAEEMRGLRRDLLLAPTINTLRNPRWARAQETYGEDPVLVGEMGAAFTKGLQDGPAEGQGMPACPKHFVGNDTDENRGGGNTPGAVNVVYPDEQTLRENYARPFEIIVEKADPACIMAAYNKVNGTLSSESKHLLTDILRTDWKWKGLTVTDWWATGDGPGAGHGQASLAAGLDCEMPTNEAFAGLGGADADGINVAAKRILDVRASFGQLTDAYITQHNGNQDTSSIAKHADLARQTEEEGAILLKNDGILPLGKKIGSLGSDTITSIIVLGPDANVPVADTSNGAHGLGDRGSSNNFPTHAVSFLKGLQDSAPPGVTVTSSGNAGDAAGKDIVIIPVTMAHEDEGEAYSGGGDRDNMTISGPHPVHWNTKASDFINQAHDANPNVIVLLAVGSAIIDSGWMASARAIVQPFYPGQEGGTAVASLLYGKLNFSGKLPFTVGTAESQYPTFGNAGSSLTVDYLHGYRRFEANGDMPQWWFGFGMSYTTYEYSELRVLCTGVAQGGRLNAEVTVKNTGTMAGDEVVQGYIGFPTASPNRHPPKELKWFARVHVEPGESAVVPIYIPARDLRYYDDKAKGWAFEPGAYKLLVGPSSDPAALKSADFTLN